LNLRVVPEAEADLADAVAWYDAHSEALGERFLAEYSRVISLILEFPEAWPLFADDYRAVRFHKFPYRVVYLPATDKLDVYAVMHLHRDPEAVIKLLTERAR
jgi:plasmid stabilization system protein ParE